MKNLNKYQKLFTGYFILMVLFWLTLLLANRKSGNLNYWYSFLFGLIPLLGGVVGMVKARLWGGLASALGKAVFFVSLGLFLWGFGETIWSYYNFFKHVPAPYPSVADIGFAPSIFFWILGCFFLSAATGARLALRRSPKAKLLVIVAPLILLVPSYYVQVHLARAGILIPKGETLLKTILDIAYPIGDFLALIFATLVYTLSRRYFGGLYRKAVLLLLAGLGVMYCADSIFSYTTTKNTYYNADWGDLLLTLGLFLITLGILAFAAKPATAPKSVAATDGDI